MDYIKSNNLKQVASISENWKNVVIILFGIILMISLISCDRNTNRNLTATPEAPTQQSEPHRLEPQEPHIFVSFSGLDETAIGYVYFRTLSGHTPVWGSRPGNGEKRVVLPERQGVIYVVTAEAEGYVSDPISYTIQLSGTRFYLVENGQITSNAVSKLDFQFKPINTPTGD